MIVLDTLNKKGIKVDIKKTNLYKSLSNQSAIFKSKNVDFKVKSMFDIFDYEILYKSIFTDNQLHNYYEFFQTENYDILSFMNYDEKRNLVNKEFSKHLNDLPSFKYQDKEIYVPMYEDHINVKLLTDYQIFDLKQHKQYIENYKVTKDNPKQLYGVLPYISSFSSLEYIKDVDGISYFYYEPTKSMYLFNNDFVGYYVLTDIKSTNTIGKDIVEKIIDTCLLNDEVKLLNVLKEENLISDKLYKKLEKKVSK